MKIKKTWYMRWDDILRDVLFPDKELAELMMIPEGTNIITWIDRYFVDYAMCTELVRDEDVRVVWAEDQSTHTTNYLVNKRKISFDIYVKLEHNKDASDDQLQSRAKLISQKLQEILTFPETVGQVAFDYVDDYDIGTRMVGYVRHTLIISYLAGHK